MTEYKGDYKGILGNPRQTEINELILISRFSSLSWREIESEVLNKFKIKVSHTLLIQYYNNVLYGEILDKCRGIGGNGGNNENEGAKDGFPTIELNQDRLNELIKMYDSKGNNPIGAFYARILALYEANLDKHSRFGERLSDVYLKHLKELNSITKGGLF